MLFSLRGTLISIIHTLQAHVLLKHLSCLLNSNCDILNTNVLQNKNHSNMQLAIRAEGHFSVWLNVFYILFLYVPRNIQLHMAHSCLNLTFNIFPVINDWFMHMSVRLTVASIWISDIKKVKTFPIKILGYVINGAIHTLFFRCDI